MLSVVVPSRDEGAQLVDCVRAVAELSHVGEIVVAAHGERPELRRSLERFPRITWVDCPRASRADQLNRGARAAQGDLLLFLHADTRLPDEGPALVCAALGQPGVVGGGFRLRFDADHPALKLLAKLSGMGWRGSFLGDQGLFCRRSDFEAVGGFGDRPLFEDVHFALQLARRGRLVRLPARVTTSARRFVAGGPWRRLGLNASLFALHQLGFPPASLARVYRA